MADPKVRPYATPRVTTIDPNDAVIVDRIGSTVRSILASNFPAAWAKITGKPADFPPSAHGHVAADVSDFAEALDDRVAALLAAGAGILITYNDAGNALTIAATAGASSPVRQTVQSGPAASGAPSFFPATSGSLSLVTQNVSGSVPLVASAAAGFGATGAADVIGVSTANLTFTATASSTTYHYVDVAGGALTPGNTTLAPIYQFGGTIAVTNGQYTFDYQAMQGWVGNGTVAAKVNRVFVGESVAGASTITSTVAYAYQGYHDSGWTATLPAAATQVTRAANLGVTPRKVDLLFECTTADMGYSVGDQVIGFPTYDTGGLSKPVQLFATRNAVGFTTSNSLAFLGYHKTSGVAVNPTLASWKYKMTADRGW